MVGYRPRAVGRLRAEGRLVYRLPGSLGGDAGRVRAWFSYGAARYSVVHVPFADGSPPPATSPASAAAGVAAAAREAAESAGGEEGGTGLRGNRSAAAGAARRGRGVSGWAEAASRVAEMPVLAVGRVLVRVGRGVGWAVPRAVGAVGRGLRGGLECMLRLGPLQAAGLAGLAVAASVAPDWILVGLDAAALSVAGLASEQRTTWEGALRAMEAGPPTWGEMMGQLEWTEGLVAAMYEPGPVGEVPAAWPGPRRRRALPLTGTATAARRAWPGCAGASARRRRAGERVRVPASDSRVAMRAGEPGSGGRGARLRAPLGECDSPAEGAVGSRR